MKTIIDAGHGFETKGKNSKFFFLHGNNKPILKENNINEAICNKLSVLNDDIVFITNEWYDVPLKTRIERERALYELKNTLFISIHSDAFDKKNVGHGGRFHYYSDKGKKIAEYFTEYLKNYGYDLPLNKPMRSNFYVLRESYSPSILFEMGFMTNEEDLKYLLDEKFRNKSAKILNDAIINFDVNLL